MHIHEDATLRIRCPRPGPQYLVDLDNRACRFVSAKPDDPCVVVVQVAGRSVDVYRGCLTVSNPSEKYRNLGGATTAVNPLQLGQMARKQQKVEAATELPASKVQRMEPRGAAQQKAWDSGSRLLLLLGIAGGGKSTIALMIAEKWRLQRGPQERIIVICNTNSDVRRKCAWAPRATPPPSHPCNSPPPSHPSLPDRQPTLPLTPPLTQPNPPLSSTGATSCTRWASPRSIRCTPSRKYSCCPRCACLVCAPAHKDATATSQPAAPPRRAWRSPLRTRTRSCDTPTRPSRPTPPTRTPASTQTSTASSQAGSTQPCGLKRRRRSPPPSSRPSAT